MFKESIWHKCPQPTHKINQLYLVQPTEHPALIQYPHEMHTNTLPHLGIQCIHIKGSDIQEHTSKTKTKTTEGTQPSEHHTNELSYPTQSARQCANAGTACTSVSFAKNVPACADGISSVNKGEEEAAHQCV